MVDAVSRMPTAAGFSRDVSGGAVRDRWPRTEPSPDAASAIGSTNGQAFRALLVLSAIMFLSPQSYLPVLAPFRVALLAAFVSLAMLLAERSKRHEPWIGSAPQVLWGFALVAWSIVTVPFSSWPSGSVNYITSLYIKNFVVFWLIGGAVRTVAELRTFAWTLSLLVLPTAIKVALDFAAGNFVTTAGVSRVGGDGGLTANPNDIALLLNIVLPLTIALLLTERSVRTRLLLVGMIGASALAIVLTYSRGGFITLIASIALHLWRVGRGPRHRWVWVAVPIALAAPALLPSSYVSRLATVFDSSSDATGSSQDRQRDMEAALSYVAANPIVGSGIGMNALALNDIRGGRYTAVHNVYLQHAAELGLPGLMLFLFLFRSSLKGAAAASRALPSSDPEGDRLMWLAQGIWISLLAFGVAAMFHPVAFHAFFYFLAGLSVAVANAHRARLRQISPGAVAEDAVQVHGRRAAQRDPQIDWRQPVWPRQSRTSRQ